MQNAGYFQFYNEAQRPLLVNGMDVARYQLNGVIDFTKAYAAGARFVNFKAGGVTYNLFQARYIRCTVNGSNVNTSSIFVELKVYDIYYNEYAAGKTVTGSQPVPQVGSYAMLTDGNLNPASSLLIVGDNTQWVQVDLGSVISNLYFVILWHYPGRKFKNNKVEYSIDGTTWTTLFDSATSGEYTEDNSPTFHGASFFSYNAVAADAQFTTIHVASARAAGLKVGAYFFKNPCYWNATLGRFMNTIPDASSEASSFYGFIHDVLGASAADTGDCFAWLDWENNGGDIYPSIDNNGCYDYISTFCNTFKYFSTGRQCGLYTAFYTIDNLTAIVPLHLCQSIAVAVGAICPLWLSVAIDTTSAYPRYDWQAFGYFSSDMWTMWQYSTYNNAAPAHGMIGTNLDLDLIEGPIENLMRPTTISALTYIGYATALKFMWLTGETDVRGYMYKVDGFTTATVGTGIGESTFIGLIPNTHYPVTFTVYDQWELSESVTIIGDTAAAHIGFYTLPCFYLP